VEYIKDVFPDHLGRSGAEPMSYQDLTATKRLWCEPGLGVVDFDAVLAALPDDYDGDFMIEVDEPSGDSRFESHRISYEWTMHNLPVIN
jgi:inosose dehydratase